MLLMAALALDFHPTIAAETPEEQLCRVCAVKEGATEPEEVAAWRTHEGVRYGLCSDACAREFDADPVAYVPPTLPRPAPELGLESLTGAPVTWESLEGRVVLVDFWATWCPPCRKSMPELQDLHDRYAARGFTALGVSIDEPKSEGKVRKFVASKKIAYPIAIDSEHSPAWHRFRVKAVPASFLVDAGGRIVAQWTGVPADPDSLERKLVELLPDID